MVFGSNLQFLRRKHGITQEQLAAHLGVSRQTISKWESGQLPELGKLMELSDHFSCKLDDLLHQDFSLESSPVRMLLLKGFSMARYRLISPNAEADLRAWMDAWASNSGLLAVPGYRPTYLSWGFPQVTPEQKTRFGLHGTEGAWLLPPEFVPACSGPELLSQGPCYYAVLTIAEPNGRDPQGISRGIRIILDHLQESGIRKAAKEGFLPCFEYRYEKDGLPMADIFLQCQEQTTAEVYTFRISE